MENTPVSVSSHFHVRTIVLARPQPGVSLSVGVNLQVSPLHDGVPVLLGSVESPHFKFLLSRQVIGGQPTFPQGSTVTCAVSVAVQLPSVTVTVYVPDLRFNSV